MRILNNFKEKIFWRAFKAGDTMYAFGLREGSIDPGHRDEWRDDSFPQIKLEVKTGSILLPKSVLAQAGRRFNMTDDLIVDGKGRLEVAKVSRKDGQPLTIQRTVVDFFDARAFNATTTRAMTFSVERALASSEGLQESHEHSRTWTVGAKAGGALGTKSTAKNGAEISAEFQDRVVEGLQKTFENQVTTVWKESVTDTFSFLPEKIYAIEITWRVVLDSGLVSYFGETTSYSALASAQGSLTTLSAFDSVEAMPDALRLRFESWQPSG
jgi:hypothetical protein